MAGLYNGHLLEFPQIRVDCFTTSTASRPHLLPPEDPSSSTEPWRPAPNARLYLLTHVHTDHLTGLSNAFTGKIVCSPDTKRMLLRLEAEIERERVDGGVREGRMLKYAGLKARTIGEGKTERMVDMIEAIPYGDPREYELGYEDGEPYKVTITLLDANHCPGSTMFLIRSKTKAVLHTGDIRADSTFIQSLRVNPAVAEFVEPTSVYPHAQSRHDWGKRTLDRIYLDTGAVLGTGDMPDREPVLTELVEQMSMYPDNTVFFLNVWCFGWEHVVKAVARHFQSPIHVDRYKRSIYQAVKTDPFLMSCTTSDPAITRFHACERRFKCDQCRTFDKSGKRIWNVNKRVVHVNMVEVKSAAWEIQQRAFRERLGLAACGEGDWPFNIDCPIARHSPLPELQALVSLFRPRSVSPNCVLPTVSGLDYFLLPAFMDGLLQSGGVERMISERDAWFGSKMCFVRNGTATLANLRSSQEAGLDLLQSLDADQATLNTHADYLGQVNPIALLHTDTKPVLGGSRRHIANDQAMRAGCLVGDTNLLPAFSIEQMRAKSSGTVSATAGETGSWREVDCLSDTDREELAEHRKRSIRGPGKRKHLVSPSQARSRVLSMHRQHSMKRAKPEPSSELDKPVIGFIKSPSISNRPEPNDLKHPYKAESTSSKLLCPGKNRLAAAPPSRYLVDSLHLAALMAVGDIPSSPM